MHKPRQAGVDDTDAVAAKPAGGLGAWRAAELGVAALGVAATLTAGALVISGTAAAAPAASMPTEITRDAAISREIARPQFAAEDSLVLAAATRPAGNPALEPRRTMYVRTKLGVLADPESGAKKLADLRVASKVSVTPETDGKYREIEFKGASAWVLRAALSNAKPSKAKVSEAKAPAAKRSVPSGSVLGLQPEAMVVYRAVMARWDVKNVGGWRAHSLSVHQFGRAIDFMTYSNTSQGYAIRNFVVAHAKEFGIDHVIYRQQIWTPYRATWRHMANRGSATANHMDHVHVAVKAR